MHTDFFSAHNVKCEEFDKFSSLGFFEINFLKIECDQSALSQW